MKNSIDVLYYIPRFYPAISGAEFYILSLAQKMKNNQYGVEILCSTSIDFKGIRVKTGYHLDNSHQNYHSYKSIPITRITPEFQIDEEKTKLLLQKVDLDYNSISKYFLQQGPNHTKFLLDLVLKNPNQVKTPKLIHSSYLPYATILFSLVLSRHWKIPAICTPFIHMYNPRYQNETFLPLLSLYDRVITCTEAEKHYLAQKGIYKEKIKTIPMGVDINLYVDPPKSRSGRTKSFKREFGITQPFVLFCGYKNYEKGAISLLHAAVKSKQKLPNLLYVFIGPSTTAFDIELKIARKHGISVLNLTPNNLTGYYDWRKISAFQECELFVMPSRSDAYGISYLEAWASKKPVIGVDTPIMQEVIHHEKDGLLVEFDNTTEISEAIESLLEDKHKSHEMGNSGFKKIQKNNSWETIHEKTLKLYRQLTNFDK